MNYLFGAQKNKCITKATFLALRQQIIDDILWLEFSRYSKDGVIISDVAFCDHLLANAEIPSKKKAAMVRKLH